MRAFIALSILAVGVYARSNDGFSSVSRTEDSLGNYQFNYDITDWDTNRKRWEVSDAYNNRKGGYSITDVDGKVRHLEYVADKAGFRAVIRTNEPGTAPGYSGDALYVRDGVKQIITAAQPALQLTGHVIKQTKIAAQPIIPVAPSPVHHYQPPPVVHQPVYQPVVHKPQVQLYQHIQPVVHVQPKPIVYQPPVVHQVVQHRPVVYQPPPVVYQQPIVHYQPPPAPLPTFHAVQQPVVFQQPAKLVAPVIPVKPALTKVEVQPVILKQEKIVVTPPPAYTGPRRRPQKLIEDPAQSFVSAELPKLSPKRIPGYNPGLDDFEDDGDDSTVPPPLSRSRVAYAPLSTGIKFAGITRKSGSFPPLAGPPSRRARA